MKLILDVSDARVLELLRAWGTPYSWAAGSPTAEGWPDGVPGLHGGIGYDCSGFVQAALVSIGILEEGSRDRSSSDLCRESLAVPMESARPGDLAFYGSGGQITHVAVYLGGGVSIGANGGTSRTNGDDPRAFVQLQPVTYRSDFLGIRRLGAG